MGTARIEAKWAIILSVIIFIMFIIKDLFGLHEPEGFQTGQIVDFAVSVLAMLYTYWACLKEKRDTVYNGVMNWGEGFWTGARMTLLMVVFIAFLLLIFVNFINTDYVNVINDTLISAGENVADGRFDFGEYLNSHCIMAGTFGLIITAIIAFFAKKEAE